MRVTDWNGFDWMLVLVVGFSVGMGFRRGVVRTVMGLAGFIGGFLLAAGNYTRFGDWINDTHMIASTSTARIVAFLLIVVLVAVVAELVARLLQKTIHAVGLGLVDRSMGAGFGFVRGCMIGIALLMIPTTFAPQSKLITTSILSPYLFAVAHDVSFLVPRYLQQQMLSGAFDFKQSSPQWMNRH
jgi:membrane protein required for colicin V production